MYSDVTIESKYGCKYLYRNKIKGQRNNKGYNVSSKVNISGCGLLDCSRDTCTCTDVVIVLVVVTSEGHTQ